MCSVKKEAEWNMFIWPELPPYIFLWCLLYGIYRWPSVYDRGGTAAKQNWCKVNLIT